MNKGTESTDLLKYCICKLKSLVFADEGPIQRNNSNDRARQRVTKSVQFAALPRHGASLRGKSTLPQSGADSHEINVSLFCHNNQKWLVISTGPASTATKCAGVHLESDADGRKRKEMGMHSHH